MSAHKLADAASLRSFFQQLSTQVIQQKLGRDIYQKGFYYYEDDAVREFDVEDANTVKTKVQGTQKYKVKIVAASGGVQVKCSCPHYSEWGELCKHIAAALIKAVEDKLWKEIPENTITEAPTSKTRKAGSGAVPNDIYETWLNSLSIEELRQTLNKLATPAFREEIRLRHGSADNRAQAFLDLKKKIQKLLNQLDGYNGGQDFDENLKPLLGKLRGIWIAKPDEVKDLFLQIIDAVIVAQEDGYMYDYYSEEAYDGSDLVDALCDFLNELPDAQRHAYLPLFWNAASEDSYDSFSSFFDKAPDYLRPADWNAVKPHLFDSELMDSADFAEKIYGIFESAIPTEEKEKWLKILTKKSVRFAVPMALLLEKEKGDAKKAAKFLDKVIESQLSEGNRHFGTSQIFSQIMEERIRLAQTLKEPLEKITVQYVGLVPQTTSLQRALDLTPGQKKALEELLRKKNIHQYLAYLESEHRLAEIVDIIEKKKQDFQFSSSYGFSRYDFYVRQKKALPQKALSCFREQLSQELPHTGDNHYHLVVDALKNMKALVPDKEFQQEIQTIRLEYKRRRNLMALLSGAFGK